MWLVPSWEHAIRGRLSGVYPCIAFHHAWRWQTPMGMVRWQLDHILTDERLEAEAAWVLDGGASDHVPVLARVAARSVGAAGGAPRGGAPR
ncbi:MAG TPA: hypothetical protein VK698_08605 [Kofleriaceae bacterium]|nr:hypothetical protein [Kofleriaceae bacterium]